VKELTIESIEVQPDDILLFPHFIFAAMARRGVGSVEAALTSTDGEPPAPIIPWQFYSRTTRAVETIAEVSRSHFRPILARLAFFCSISPYAGETGFSTQWPVCGSPATHRFKVFLCNEPTMAFWVRIYLYAIDGFYPIPKAATPDQALAANCGLWRSVPERGSHPPGSVPDYAARHEARHSSRLAE
jgi:hypothetical protein